MSSSNAPITASRSGGGGPESGGYSASVRLFLRVRGETVPLAQVGGGRLYFDAPVVLPGGPAEVIVEIDGEPRSSAVVLRECPRPARIVAYSAA